MAAIVLVLLMCAVLGAAAVGGWYFFIREKDGEEATGSDAGSGTLEACPDFHERASGSDDCVLNEKKFYESFGNLVAHYTVDNVDIANNKWGDATLSGKGFAKDGKFVTGTTESIVKFPDAILPENYTFIHVAKYNGTSKGRIMNGQESNWLSGFHGNKVGVAYHGHWMTKTESAPGLKLEDTIISVDQKGAYRANGKSQTINQHVGPAKQKIGINTGPHTESEKSDWAVAEVLVYDSELSTEKIKELEKHFADKYSITLLEGFANVEGFGNLDDDTTNVDYFYL